MTSKSAEEASRLTSTLTGISLAVGIAREAADAVPIVKQCLGAAVRIVALAEKIDKDREALHSLSDKSLQLAERVKHVMEGRVPDAKLETSLGRILKALESIETFMAKHFARGRMRRVISYAFTVPQHVGRLSGELADAVQELIVVGLLDVDHQVHATHAALEDNARFSGEFRLLRHCEVHKLDRVFDPRDNDEDSNAVVRYHRARVDGQVLVVRYCEDIGTPDPDALHGSEEPPYDLLLKDLSTVQKSHPNVARIYGWGKGSIHNRFTVFKSGYQPARRIAAGLPDLTASVIQWAYKVLVENNGLRIIASEDAADHLRRQGICWYPIDPPYVLDEHLEPTIGLQNDLYRVDPTLDLTWEIEHQISSTLDLIAFLCPSQDVAATDVRAAVGDCFNEQLTGVFSKLETIGRQRDVISKADLSNGLVLNDSTAERLLRLLAEDVFYDAWHVDTRMWANILLALDKKRNHRLQIGLRVTHYACNDGSNWLDVHGLAEDSERIVYDVYCRKIPNEQSDEVRAMFGIAAPSEDEPRRWRLIATGGPGTYRAPE